MLGGQYRLRARFSRLGAEYLRRTLVYLGNSEMQAIFSLRRIGRRQKFSGT
jgi:hypothetical protein